MKQDDLDRVEATLTGSLREGRRMLHVITDACAEGDPPEGPSPEKAAGVIAAVLLIGQMITESMSPADTKKSYLLAKVLQTVIDRDLSDEQVEEAVAASTNLAVMKIARGDQGSDR